MEDTLNKRVVSIAGLLEDNNAKNVEVIKVTGLCSWGDYIIIATGTSETHIRGLKTEVKKYVLESGDDIKNPRQRDDTSGWILFDCGDYIVNLMDEESREFYDLGNRWKEAEVLYQSSSSS
jgi:ribosome-associated protein